MNDYVSKIESSMMALLSNLKEPQILELGVQSGKSTQRFLEICDKQNGRLFSVDIDDCSEVSKNNKWCFIHSRDDNFEMIKSKIPKKLDVIFIDTLHEAKHVKKLIYFYYDLLKINGYMFIDDISHLPYLNNKKTSFYCEINNKETFNEIIKIFYYNQNCFDLNFSFQSSGLAIIKKKNDSTLVYGKNLVSRDNSLKNILRKITLKFKK